MAGRGCALPAAGDPPASRTGRASWRRHDLRMASGCCGRPARRARHWGQAPAGASRRWRRGRPAVWVLKTYRPSPHTPHMRAGLDVAAAAGRRGVSAPPCCAAQPASQPLTIVCAPPFRSAAGAGGAAARVRRHAGLRHQRDLQPGAVPRRQVRLERGPGILPAGALRRRAVLEPPRWHASVRGCWCALCALHVRAVRPATPPTETPFAGALLQCCRSSRQRRRGAAQHWCGPRGVHFCEACDGAHACSAAALTARRPSLRAPQRRTSGMARCASRRCRWRSASRTAAPPTASTAGSCSPTQAWACEPAEWGPRGMQAAPPCRQ